jgi:16S rRNA (adenine1518-N6/adenine1519-N6)-dimethyltransferase
MAEDISALLRRHKFRFSKSMGQNFLIDDSVPERIADLSGADGNTHVLEVGPGIGALTARLCERAGFVTAVELDRALLPILRETLEGYSNYEIIQGDILKLDIKSTVAQNALTRKIAVANLPYNITTPAITALLLSGAFETVTVMVQREVARRICASPGTADYGAFTVFSRYHAEPEILFDVPPESFMPRPNVYSSVVRLKVLRESHGDIPDERMFFRVVRASFSQRRKTLVNALSAGFPELTKERLTEIIRAQGHDERIRGETLGLREFAAVAIAVKSEIGAKSDGE